MHSAHGNCLGHAVRVEGHAAYDRHAVRVDTSCDTCRYLMRYESIAHAIRVDTSCDTSPGKQPTCSDATASKLIHPVYQDAALDGFQRLYPVSDQSGAGAGGVIDQAHMQGAMAAPVYVS